MMKGRLLIKKSDALFFWGSCFSDNIPIRLSQGKVPCYGQSHGILFNPISIVNAIKDVDGLRDYKEEDLSMNDDIYFSYQHHGRFSGLNSDLVLDRINTSISDNHAFWKNASRKVVFLTLGTSFCYRLKENGVVVANCHKMPSSLFEKQMIHLSDSVTAIEEVLSLLNKDDHVVLTVSPVKHLRDGLVENSQSKSALILACKDLTDKYDQVHYFPAYEYVIDELRDYRYFERDGAHPNALAIDYVWDRLKDTYLDQNLCEQIADFQSLFLSLSHRPKYPGSKASNKLKTSLLSKLEQLRLKYPTVDLSAENETIISRF